MIVLATSPKPSGVNYPTEGLQALYEPWRGDQGDDQVLTDFSGNGFHGQLGSTAGSDTNDPTWVSDVGLRFDGIDDYVVATLTGATGSVVTVSMVAKASSGNRAWASGNSTNIDWTLFNEGTTLNWRSSPGNQITALVSNTQYVHVVAIGDGTEASLYINNVLVAGPTTIAAFANHPTVWIGQLGTGIYYFSDDIALVGIHNIALDSDARAAAYSYAKATLPAGITGDLP